MKSLIGTESDAIQPHLDRAPVGADLLRNTLVLVFASAASVALSAWIIVSIRGRHLPAMTDLIDVSYPDYPKQTDFWMIALWGVLTVVIGLCALASSRIRTSSSRVALAILNRPGLAIALLAATTPIVPAVVGATLLDPSAAIRSAVVMAVPLTAAAIAVSVGQLRGQTVGDVLTSLVLITCGVLAFATTAAVLTPVVSTSLGWSWQSGAALVAVTITGLGTWATASTSRLHRVGLLSQCAAPALLLVLIAPLGEATTPGLILVVALLMLGALFVAVRHCKQLWNSPPGTGLVAPITVVIVAVYLLGVLRMPTGGVPADEYHWGELMVQWDQLTRFGSTPFGSFEPTPGLNGFVYGALNQLLGGGAITFERASQLFAAAVSGLSALLAWRIMGVEVALLMTPAIAGVAGAALGDRFALVGLGILVLALPALWRRPVFWLGIWVLVVAANMLFIAGNGVAFGLATAPALILQVRNAVRGIRRVGVLDIVVAIAAVGMLVTQAETLRGVLRFVVSQGADNNLAWGFPLLPSLTPAGTVYTVAIDSIRAAGWWLGIPIALAMLATHWRHKAYRGVTLLASVTLLMAVVLTPYVFGRIEGSGLSRVGMATFLILGVMLPLAALGERARLTGAFGDLLVRSSAVMIAAMISLPLGIAARGVSPIRPIGGPVLDGAEIGLPGIGDGPAPQAEFLTVRATLLNTVLRADDVFLDMSSHPAFYFYSGRQVPTPVAAAWNMSGRQEQTAVVEALETNPPTLVLPEVVASTGPSWIDPQLRAYRVNRWLLEAGYTAWDSSGTIFLLGPDALDRVTADMRQLTPEEADAILVGEYPRLGTVYRSWGRNWDLLSGSFTTVPTSVDATSNTVRLSWSGEALKPDFVKLELTCPVGSVPGPTLAKWSLQNGSQQEVRLPLQPGVSLVPLGAYPSWYQRDGNSLSMSPGEGCQFADPGSMQLLRLTS